MAVIPLSRGLSSIVDDADYDWLNKHKWHASAPRSGGRIYAVRMVPIGDGKKTSISMHRAILRPEPGIFVDHINCDGADNRRCNLRLCTNQMNQWNRRNRDWAVSTSRYKGVHWAQDRRKWRAAISHNDVPIKLGDFDTEIEAAMVYDEAARTLFGDYARTNFGMEQAA